MRKILLLLAFFSITFVKAQELNCTVVVNADKVTNVDKQIFKSLERSLNDFVNKTAWTEKSYKDFEKINCSMFITVNSFENNNFDTTIQVQSSRPVYNSSYTAPILNINDKDLAFQYIEFQNLTFNPNNYESNLISTIAFYAYIIIGVDAETFSVDSGTPFFQLAQNVASNAIPSGVASWSQSDKTQNRYYLISDLLSPTYKPYREAMYQYHFNGLDKMSSDLKASKQAISNSINSLRTVYDLRPSAYLLRIFFDAKSDEIVSIFTGGPTIPIDDLIDNLNRISPTNVGKWSSIKP